MDVSVNFFGGRPAKLIGFDDPNPRAGICVTHSIPCHSNATSWMRRWRGPFCPCDMVQGSAMRQESSLYGCDFL